MIGYSVEPEPTLNQDLKSEVFSIVPVKVWEFHTLEDGLCFLDIRVMGDGDYKTLDKAISEGGCWISDPIGMFFVEKITDDKFRFSRWPHFDSRRRIFEMLKQPCIEDGMG